MSLGLTNWELYSAKDKYITWDISLEDGRIIPEGLCDGQHQHERVLKIRLGPYAKWTVLSTRELGFDTDFFMLRPPGDRDRSLKEKDEWVLLTFPRTLVLPRRTPALGWEIVAVDMRGSYDPIRNFYWIDDWFIIRYTAPDQYGVSEMYRSDAWSSFRVVGTDAVSDETWKALEELHTGSKCIPHITQTPTCIDQQTCATPPSDSHTAHKITPREGSAPEVDQLVTFIQQRLKVTIKRESLGGWYTAMHLFNRRTLANVRIAHPVTHKRPACIGDDWTCSFVDGF